jgi:magnesium-transporting ATPase (P-type)
MSALGFGVFHVWLPPDPTDAQIAQARNALLLLLVLFENVHLGNCRSETVSLFRLSPLRSPVLLIGALAALALHLWAMHSDWGRSLLGVQPIPAVQWFTLVGLALTLLPVMELHKWWCSRRRTAEGGTMCGIRKTA